MFEGRYPKAANVAAIIDCLDDASLDRRALRVMEETVVDWRRFRMANIRLSARSV